MREAGTLGFRYRGRWSHSEDPLKEKKAIKTEHGQRYMVAEETPAGHQGLETSPPEATNAGFFYQRRDLDGIGRLLCASVLHL